MLPEPEFVQAHGKNNVVAITQSSPLQNGCEVEAYRDMLSMNTFAMMEGKDTAATWGVIVTPCAVHNGLQLATATG